MKKNNKKKNILTKKEMLKETINKLLPGFILIFVSSFMFFIYEPLLMYATNINDFWFDFSTLLSSNIIIFICFFLFLFAIYIGIYFIDKAFFKKNILLNIFTVILFGLFLVFYIQGNFLIKDLPKLDGRLIFWNEYPMQNLISIIIFNIVFISLIISCFKFKIKKVLNATKYISLAIFAMLSVSLLSAVLTTEDIFEEKNIVYSTNDGFGKYSSDENFIIFLVDSVDSVMFNEIVKDSEYYSDTFEDFTYYPDTVAAYLYTRESVPFILTGIWNKNETSYKKYSVNAYNKSKLFNNLKEKEYEMNYYNDAIVLEMSEKTANNISNLKVRSKKTKINKLYLEELKYISFKYLPFPFKKYSKIDELNFNSTWNANKDEFQNMFNHINTKVYNMINNTNLEIVKEKQFKFIHVEGAHVPFDYDENLNYTPNEGTYESKMAATLKIINTYLNKLKQYDLYDNSNIIIMSDHGYSYAEGDERQASLLEGRQNPILYIKGIDEKHEMYISDIPVSQSDLNDVYKDLMNGKTSEELFDNIDKDRERKFIYYEFGKENYMEEYIQTGKAWDEDTIVKTGKKFNR